MLNFLKNLKLLLIKIKNNPKVMYEYLLGNYRYYCINNRVLYYLIRPHIEEQYYFRLNKMKDICFTNGECIKCGCQTPQLQMANKACEGACYPDIMTKEEWINYNNY